MTFMTNKCLFASFGMMMMPQDDDDGFTTTSTTSGLPSLVHPHGSSLHPCFEEVYEEEDGTASALRIHSQAEKRRRERINARLSTLRRMIPDSNKVFSFIFSHFCFLFLVSKSQFFFFLSLFD